MQRQRGDGTLALRIQVCGHAHGEVGQGARTALSQVVAEELAIPFDAVTVAQLDTEITPYDVNTNASSSMVVMGPGARAESPRPATA